MHPYSFVANLTPPSKLASASQLTNLDCFVYFYLFPWLSQGEQAGCKRLKKLELAIAALREQVAALALSEQKAAETTVRAEARAAAAEAAETELRKAVEAIKYDFEVR